MQTPTWTSRTRSENQNCYLVEKSSPSTQLPDTGRETWSKKIGFTLAVIGFAVDLGGILRFSYICYVNGGGAFLIPYYCKMLIFGGLPLFYKELALRQYYKSSCITVWSHICPALQGIGYTICIINFYVEMHYNTTAIRAVYYLLQRYQADLPWIHYNNVRNSESCLSLNETRNRKYALKLKSSDIASNNDSTETANYYVHESKMKS